jgi:hypothetical protein
MCKMHHQNPGSERAHTHTHTHTHKYTKNSALLAKKSDGPKLPLPGNGFIRRIYVCMYAFTYVCFYVRIYTCMYYVCVCVCVCVCVDIVCILHLSCMCSLEQHPTLLRAQWIHTNKFCRQSTPHPLPHFLESKAKQSCAKLLYDPQSIMWLLWYLTVQDC